MKRKMYMFVWYFTTSFHRRCELFFSASIFFLLTILMFTIPWIRLFAISFIFTICCLFHPSTQWAIAFFKAKSIFVYTTQTHHRNSNKMRDQRAKSLLLVFFFFIISFNIFDELKLPFYNFIALQQAITLLKRLVNDILAWVKCASVCVCVLVLSARVFDCMCVIWVEVIKIQNIAFISWFSLSLASIFLSFSIRWWLGLFVYITLYSSEMGKTTTTTKIPASLYHYQSLIVYICVYQIGLEIKFHLIKEPKEENFRERKENIKIKQNRKKCDEMCLRRKSFGCFSVITIGQTTQLLWSVRSVFVYYMRI